MKIFFASGKMEEIEMTAKEFDGMIKAMKESGVRFIQLRNGNYIPINSSTMEIIESELVEKQRRRIAEPKPVEVIEAGVVEEIKEESKDVGSEARAKEALEEMMRKSSCKHEDKDQLLCKSVGKKGVRYFKVCQSCGYRSRFISGDLLTEGEKESAKAFTE